MFSLLGLLTGLFLLTFSATSNLGAQNTDTSALDLLFSGSELVHLKLDIDPEDLKQHLDRRPLPPEDRVDVPARLIIQASGMITEMNISVRVREPQSIHYPDPFKRSYLIEFPENAPIPLKKLLVNSESPDPTLIRSVLAHRIASRIGLPIPKSTHARLYINSEYRGLYTIVEPVDDLFLQDEFGMGDGSLYKAGLNADLSYLGRDPYQYDRIEKDGRPRYAALQSPEQNPHTDLADFITFLATAPTNGFVPALRTRFNVDAFLRWMAFETLLGHWDNYWYDATNFYLYANPESGRFEYIPAEVDDVFGIWFGEERVDWATRNIYEWGQPGVRRLLIDRILGQDELLNQYTYYVQYIIDTVFMLQRLKFDIEDLQDTILEAVKEDTFRTLDYGFTLDEFYIAYNDSVRNHVTHGLYSYIRARSATIINQLIWLQIKPIIRSVSLDEVPISQDEGLTREQLVTFKVYAQSNIVFNVELFSEDGTRLLELKDDGSGMDENRSDNIYTGNLNLESNQDVRRVYIQAKDLNSITQRYPFQSGTYIPLPSQSTEGPLLINEIGLHSDGSGWVELYNSGTVELPLLGHYLTSSDQTPFQFRLEEQSFLMPGEFIVIDLESLKTPKGVVDPMGGQLLLYRKNGLKAEPTDSVQYPLLELGQSYGRDADSNRPFRYYEYPTPGQGNGFQTSTTDFRPKSDEALSNQIILYPSWPNPFNPSTKVRFNLPDQARVRLDVHDVTGRHLKSIDAGFCNSGINETEIDLTGYPSGLYMYSIITSYNQARGWITLAR